MVKSFGLFCFLFKLIYGVIVRNKEIIQKWIKHWELMRDLAGRDGNYEAWKSADNEIKNYQEMLKAERWLVK